MKEKILMLILTMILTASVITMTVFAVEMHTSGYELTNPTTFSEDYIPSEPTTSIPIEEEVIILDTVEVERVVPTTLDEANKLLEDAIFRKDTAITVYEGLLLLGYSEEHPAVIMAKTNVVSTEEDFAYYVEYQTILQEKEHWRICAEEYPVATQVWLYMKNELGFNDIVCAGIMGNMMAECGGCWTSDLKWNISGSSGYGMIQWLGSRKAQLFSIYGNNPSIEDQLNFMKDELYGTNGVTKQVTDSQLDKIINADSPEDCAYAFACYFERCGEGHRAVRKDYARRAYEYFVG